MPWRKIGKVWTEEGFLVTAITLATVVWIAAAVFVWRDILRNREATDRAQRELTNEIRQNREMGQEILRRLPQPRPE